MCSGYMRTSVADAHADAERLVGPMDQVSRKPEIQCMRPERIVRSGTDRPRQWSAAPGGFLTDRVGRKPDRTGLLPDDAGLSERSLPTDPADTDGPCAHDRLALRVVVDPHLCNIDHQTGTRGLGEDEPRRQPDGSALAREPSVDSGVGKPEFRKPHPETPRYVEQRVLVPCDVDLVAAHHRFTRVRPPHHGIGSSSRNRHRDGGCEKP